MKREKKGKKVAGQIGKILKASIGHVIAHDFSGHKSYFVKN
jgi:hypothetical protein